ncbi:MAG: phosphoribosylformylglycinamidine synthase subunit PurQ [Clostridia bacterium]|nr:phosphoribosylformylglycinamidine synthase subunit PurQ [Clostridia bacterium]
MITVQGKQKIVILLPVEANTANSNVAISLTNECNTFGYALRCQRGLLATLLKAKIGCKLDFDALSNITTPLNALVQPSDNMVIAIVSEKNSNKVYERASNFGYHAEVLGITLAQPKIKVEKLNLALLNMDIDFMRGETMFLYADMKDKDEIFSVSANKHLTKKAVCDIFAAVCRPKDKATDFAEVGRIACAPYGGKTRLTPSQVMATHSKEDKKIVVTSRQDYNGKINSPFLAAVYSYIVSLAKLVASGVTPDAVTISGVTPLLKKKEQLADEFLFRLGLFYTKQAFHNGIFANDEEESASVFDHSVSAGALTDYDKMSSNVYPVGKKVFCLPLKRESGFMPDFKYLKKLFRVVSINISTGNIVAASVVEDSILHEVLKSCIGENCGFSFAKGDTGILNVSYGDLIVAVNDISELQGLDSEYLGITDNTGIIKSAEVEISMEALYRYAKVELPDYKARQTVQADTTVKKATHLYTGVSRFTPAVFLPVFDKSYKLIERGFVRAGGKVAAHPYEEFTQAYLRETRQLLEVSDIVVLSATPKEQGDSKSSILNFITHPVILDSINELLFRRDGLLLAFGEAFYSLIESGFLPYGRYVEQTTPSYRISRLKEQNTGKISRAKIVSNSSPWLSGVPIGSVYSTVTASGECTVQIAEKSLNELLSKAQICAQYVDFEDMATALYPYNPIGNTAAIESLCSPDGRIFGSVGHNFKVSQMFNVKETTDLDLFRHGIEYFR